MGSDSERRGERGRREADALDRFAAALEELGFFAGGGGVLVGVSGGADSTALLSLLAGLRARRDGVFPRLVVGHVHHGIRGGDADEDARFVESLAGALGVEFVLERGDAPAQARALGLSPEAAAREVRFRAFLRWTESLGLAVVCLAHHRLDRAETLLLRAIRGAGIRGLAAMAPSGVLPGSGGGVRVLRPLLDWTRSEILDYLRGEGRTFRTDSSNEDRSIPRNRIRLEVLPLLEATQAGAVRSLSRLGAIAADVRRDLLCLGRRAYSESRLEEERSGRLRFSIEALRAWPPSVLREFVPLALERLGGPPGDPGSRESEGGLPPENPVRLPEGFVSLLLRRLEPSGASPSPLRHLERTGGAWALEVRLGYGILRFEWRREDREVPDLSLGSSPPPRVVWGDWVLEFEELRVPPGWRLPSVAPGVAWEENLDLDVLCAAGPLSLRARRVGDRMRPLGGGGSKLLKEIFRESRIPPGDRARVPLLAAGEAIAWVVGCRIGEDFRVSEGTRRVLVARARRGGPAPES